VSTPRLSRRRFLVAGAASGAGALAAGAGTGTADAASRHRRRRKVDVAVVGGGFAGLSAAWDVMRAGHSVLVLEAQGHVGGRARNRRIGGGEITERGATFAGPTQNKILALAKEMGVATFPTYDEGQAVYFADGERLLYSDTSPLGTAPPDPLVVPDVAQVIPRLDDMATRVPVDAPWRAQQALEWDSQTFDTWIRDNSSNTPRFKQLVAAAMRPIFGAEAREVSLLYVLFYIAASGDEQHQGTFERNFNTRDGAQMFRFEGGSQRIAIRLARRLGKRVVLHQPVQRIQQSSKGVTVTSRSLRVHAKRVIVTAPPALAARIEYGPPLLIERDQLTQDVRQGNLMKVTAVYDRPFWREQGLSGTGITLNGPANVVFDDSPEDGSPGVLFGFIGGDSARDFYGRRPRERRALALQGLADLFGPQALGARAYYESTWPAERWHRGGPVGLFSPGTLVSHGHALREPIGRIHWAGTESSTYWIGYMDGAVRSGQRAAAEVLAAL
jgi:monoamine oxidase